MHDNDLAGAQQLLRNDDAAQCIWGSAAGIADYMGIAFFKTEGAGGIYNVVGVSIILLYFKYRRVYGPRRASMQATTATFLKSKQ